MNLLHLPRFPWDSQHHVALTNALTARRYIRRGLELWEQQVFSDAIEGNAYVLKTGDGLVYHHERHAKGHEHVHCREYGSGSQHRRIWHRQNQEEQARHCSDVGSHASKCQRDLGQNIFCGSVCGQVLICEIAAIPSHINTKPQSPSGAHVCQ